MLLTLPPCHVLLYCSTPHFCTDTSSVHHLYGKRTPASGGRPNAAGSLLQVHKTQQKLLQAIQTHSQNCTLSHTSSFERNPVPSLRMRSQSATLHFTKQEKCFGEWAFKFPEAWNKRSTLITLKTSRLVTKPHLPTLKVLPSLSKVPSSPPLCAMSEARERQRTFSSCAPFSSLIPSVLCLDRGRS